MASHSLIGKLGAARDADAKKIDVWQITKTVICIAAFLASIAFFSMLCAELKNNYLILLIPSIKIIVPWLIKISVIVLLVMITLGVLAVLVRPLWIAIASSILGSALYALIIGPDAAVLISTLIFCAFLFSYLFFVAWQLKNQVRFSTHPLGEKKILVGLILAVLISVSFGLGYNKDAAQRAYIIPPEIKTFIQDTAINTVKQLIDQQAGTARQKDMALQEIAKKIEVMLGSAEQKIQPYQKYIAIGFGVLAFFIFQMVFLVVSLIAPIFLTLTFFILKLIRFTHTVVEKCEARRLTLKTIV